MLYRYLFPVFWWIAEAEMCFGGFFDFQILMRWRKTYLFSATSGCFESILYAFIKFSYICYLVYIAFGIFVNNNCPMKLYAFRIVVINSQNSTYAPKCIGLCQPKHPSSVPMDESYNNQVWSKPLASSSLFICFF